MSTNATCQAPGCYKQAIVRCQSCDRAFCVLHTVILSHGEVAASMGGSERLHRYLSQSDHATVWLCEQCAAFTVPHAARGEVCPA